MHSLQTTSEKSIDVFVVIPISTPRQACIRLGETLRRVCADENLSNSCEGALKVRNAYVQDRHVHPLYVSASKDELCHGSRSPSIDRS